MTRILLYDWLVCVTWLEFCLLIVSHVISSLSEAPSFTLVDSTGSEIQGEELGLLLYNGGTVCDDSFDSTAADAICKLMNYTDSARWTTTESFHIQVREFTGLWSVSECHVTKIQSSGWYCSTVMSVTTIKLADLLMCVTWLSQSNYEITLDNVDCPRAEWESCTFSEDHNCAHSEDVFLRCNTEEEGTTMTTGESWKPSVYIFRADCSSYDSIWKR